MVTWSVTAGSVIIIAITAAFWWWGVTSWLVSAFATAVIVIAELWWWVPRWQANSLRLRVRDAKARADLEDNFRKTIGQFFGGAAVLIGAGFAYYQFTGQQQASHDQLISQQVSIGFEQLGNDKVAVRLGGIYALEAVMNTSEQYRQPVLEALCAFVREAAKSQAATAKPMQGDTSKRPPDSGTPESTPPATDIQAALTVIGRRAAGKGRVDLMGANLSSAYLFGADLSEANLIGADLNRAYLFGANLTGANLIGAHLSEANLFGAKLSRANLFGAKLNRANLSKANLGRANLSKADLSAVNLIGAQLISANLSGADLVSSDLSRANLTDASVSQDQLNWACGNADTKLPAGMTIKPCRPQAP